MSKMKVLWLVAARSGSKSLPNKNIRILNGIPLIAYRIQSALKCNFPEFVWISTDSNEYAQIAREYGAQVQFLRPSFLAEDSSNSVDVVLHAMHFAQEQNFEFDYIGLLEPTSPFISENDLNEALLKLSQTEDAHAIVAVKESRPHPIFVQENSNYLEKIAKNISSLNKLGRQEFETQITPSGGFYIARWNSFLKAKSFYTAKTLSYLVDDIAGLEIDNPIDFLFAEFIASQSVTKPNS
jgi:CMP-N,N'-diacetyllegionaminic acid synthase